MNTARDLDAAKVPRALFHDMPWAPQGLTREESVEWMLPTMAARVVDANYDFPDSW